MSPPDVLIIVHMGLVVSSLMVSAADWTIPSRIRSQYMSTIPSSWQVWYNEPMNSTMNVSHLLPSDNVECLMWGTSDGTSYHRLYPAAFANQSEVAQIFTDATTADVHSNSLYWFHEVDEVSSDVVVGFSIYSHRHLYGTYGGYGDYLGFSIRRHWAMKWRLGSSEGIRGLHPDSRKVVMFGPCEIECEEDMYFGSSECVPCPAGYHKDVGAANVCVPTLAAVFQDRSAPQIYVTMLEDNVLRVRIRLDALPDEIYRSNVSVSYRLDIAPTEAALHFDSSCSRLWTLYSQSSSYSWFEATVSSANGPCSFTETIEGAYAEWSTFVAAFVVADSGEVSPPHFRPFTLKIDRGVGQVFEGGGGWGYRIITTPAQTITINGPSSTLQIFASPAYAPPLSRAFFTEGEDVFVEHKLDSSGLGFTLEAKLVWLSTSRDPNNRGGLVHDLAAEVGNVVGVGGVRYSFKARGDGCESGCWLHSLIQVADGSSRRLEATTLAFAREADRGDSFAGASAGLTITPRTTTPPEHEEAAVEPDLHEFRHPAVIIVAAVGVANAVTWPTVACILHCRAVAPADLAQDQQRYRILSEHALMILAIDLLRTVLGVASFALAWHLKELEVTSDPDVMLGGLLVFASLGGFLFVVEATGWTFLRRSGRWSGVQQPKSIVALAFLYLLIADIPTVVVYAGIAFFGWLDGAFPWVSTLGVVFAVVLLVVKLVTVFLAAKTAERAATTLPDPAGIPGVVSGSPEE